MGVLLGQGGGTNTGTSTQQQGLKGGMNGSPQQGGLKGENGNAFPYNPMQGVSGGQQQQPFSTQLYNSGAWQPNMGNYTGAPSSGTAANTGQQAAQAFQGVGQGYWGSMGPQSPWSSQSNPSGQTSNGTIVGGNNMQRMGTNTANIFGGR